MENAIKPDDKLKAVKKHKVKSLVVTLLPLIALAVLFGVYLLLLIVNDYSIERNLTALLNQAIVLMFVATGAIFIFTLGSFDISLGASTLFSATVGILAFNATGSIFVLFLVCLGVAIVCSLLNSVIASVFHLPMFVTTVAMLSVLTALATSIINSKGAASGTTISINVSPELRDTFASLDNVWFKLAVLAVFALLCLFIFNFTKIGRRQKFLGGNPICAKMTGISNSLYGIIAFVMAGIGVGLGAAMTIVYTPTVSNTTAGSIGMSVFIAIVFGGMPISGGPRSRIYAALVGGVSYMLLKNILFMLFSSVGGARDGYVQIISAVLFLAVVFAASVNYRSKNLPR